MGQRSGTVASSATRSGTNTHSENFDSYHHTGVLLIVDATASNGDGTQDLTVTIQYDDPASGKTLTLLTDTFSNGATGTRKYLIYPGVSDTQVGFDAIQETPVPRPWEVKTEVLQGGASPDYTYSIGAIAIE